LTITDPAIEACYFGLRKEAIRHEEGVVTTSIGRRAFVTALGGVGYAEGSDFVIEWRSAEGNCARFPDLAAELVGLKVDIIVTGVTAAMRALQG
jgi:hypothetical protein